MADPLSKRAKKLNEQAEDISALEGFEDDIVALRIKWGLPKTGIQDSEEANSWRSNLPHKKWQKFEADIGELAAKYNLAHNWHWAITTYVIINRLGGWHLTPRVGHKLGPNDEITDLHISLDKETTLKDVESVWSTVEMLQKDMPGRFSKKYKAKSAATKKRDSKIMKLHKDGLSNTEIGKQVGLSYSEVGTIVRNNKRRQGIS